jgi:hypothetical protein
MFLILTKEETVSVEPRMHLGDHLNADERCPCRRDRLGLLQRWLLSDHHLKLGVEGF